MNSGWILSILDTHTKDEAFKYVAGDRDRAEAKRVKFQSQYNALEISRYQVRLSSQYSELSPQSVACFRCKLKEGYTANELSVDLDLELFARKSRNGSHRFEIDASELSRCRDLLEQLDSVINYELEIPQTR